MDPRRIYGLQEDLKASTMDSIGTVLRNTRIHRRRAAHESIVL